MALMRSLLFALLFYPGTLLIVLTILAVLTTVAWGAAEPRSAPLPPSSAVAVSPARR